jgi:hypothetical protein
LTLDRQDAGPFQLDPDLQFDQRGASCDRSRYKGAAYSRRGWWRQGLGTYAEHQLASGSDWRRKATGFALDGKLARDGGIEADCAIDLARLDEPPAMSFQNWTDHAIAAQTPAWAQGSNVCRMQIKRRTTNETCLAPATEGRPAQTGKCAARLDGFLWAPRICVPAGLVFTTGIMIGVVFAVIFATAIVILFLLMWLASGRRSTRLT